MTSKVEGPGAARPTLGPTPANFVGLDRFSVLRPTKMVGHRTGI